MRSFYLILMQCRFLSSKFATRIATLRSFRARALTIGRYPMAFACKTPVGPRSAAEKPHEPVAHSLFLLVVMYTNRDALRQRRRAPERPAPAGLLRQLR